MMVRGRFEEVARLHGIAFDRNGVPQGSMGADVGDYNGDGRLDIFQTAYQNQHATLYENLGGGLFHDVTPHVGAGERTTAASIGEPA
jgi:enediyne biosynthesis protein E4